MRHDTDISSTSGGSVRIYERPSRWTTLAPLIWILLAGLILGAIIVLLWRQN
jgi:hypothetical protein